MCPSSNDTDDGMLEGSSESEDSGNELLAHVFINQQSTRGTTF